LRIALPATTTRLIEPCAGSGVIVCALRRQWPSLPVLGCDVRDMPELRQSGLDELWIGDWLSQSRPALCAGDSVITNPPYSLAFEFVQSCVGQAGYVAMLLRLDFLGSLARAQWLQENPPTQLYILSRRPSFTQDAKTDQYNYAWFVWQKQQSFIQWL